MKNRHEQWLVFSVVSQNSGKESSMFKITNIESWVLKYFLLQDECFQRPKWRLVEIPLIFSSCYWYRTIGKLSIETWKHSKRQLPSTGSCLKLLKQEAKRLRLQANAKIRKKARMTLFETIRKLSTAAFASASRQWKARRSHIIPEMREKKHTWHFLKTLESLVLLPSLQFPVNAMRGKKKNERQGVVIAQRIEEQLLESQGG